MGGTVGGTVGGVGGVSGVSGAVGGTVGVNVADAVGVIVATAEGGAVGGVVGGAIGGAVSKDVEAYFHVCKTCITNLINVVCCGKALVLQPCSVTAAMRRCCSHAQWSQCLHLFMMRGSMFMKDTRHTSYVYLEMRIYLTCEHAHFCKLRAGVSQSFTSDGASHLMELHI